MLVALGILVIVFEILLIFVMIITRQGDPSLDVVTHEELSRFLSESRNSISALIQLFWSEANCLVEIYKVIGEIRPVQGLFIGEDEYSYYWVMPIDHPKFQRGAKQILTIEKNIPPHARIIILKAHEQILCKIIPPPWDI